MTSPRTRRARVRLLSAAFLLTALPVAARADDRDLCASPPPDLTCLTYGAGFHVVPQGQGPLPAWFATLDAPAALYGASGWTQAWAVPTASGKPDGSVVLWAGSADTAELHGQPGSVFVGGSDWHVQAGYPDLTAGDGAVFAAAGTLAQLGPRTLVAVHYAGHPVTVDLARARGNLSSLRLVVDRPFVARRTASGRTCLFWAVDSAVCLEGIASATAKVAVRLDRDGAIKAVTDAGKTPARAKAETPALGGIVAALAGLPVTYY